MNTPQKLKTTSLKSIEFRYWKQRPLYEYYPKLKAFLSLKLGKEFENIIAEPRLTKDKNGLPIVEWKGYGLGNDFAVLDEIDDRELINQVINKIGKVNGFVGELLESKKSEDREWGKILQQCFSNVPSDQIFFDGKNFVVSAWGLDLNPEQETLPFSKGFKIKPTLPQDTESISPQEDETDDLEPTFNEGQVTEERDRGSSSLNLPETDLSRDEDTSNTDFTPSGFQEEKEEIPTKIDQEQQQEREPVADSSGIDDKDPPKKSPWFRWWWVGLLLLLLILFLLLRSCGTTEQLLPQQPGKIIPVDSTDIVIDDDSLRYVVKDRLNIILRGENQDIDAFANAFKEAYPDDEFEIIYYDTLTHRFQIKVPEAQRQSLIKEIPEKITDFKMLVWHENIYINRAQPNDPGFSNASVSWYFRTIKAQSAWNASYGDPNVVVAVIDDGFDLTHPELRGKVQSPWNAVYQDQNLLAPQGGKHGTHVAGTAVGSRDNQSGLAGIAPDCTLMPIRITTNGGVMSTTAIVDGILYAINQGADVINLSLGIYFPPNITMLPPGMQKNIIDNTFPQEETFWRGIFEIAEENNVSVVVAGGNQNSLIGLDPMTRSPNAIKVSATNQSNQKANFSNFGELSTISAPGVAIYSSVPGNDFESMKGTSMAAPIVTGAVALLKSIDPNLTPQQIRNILVNTAINVDRNIGPLLQLGPAIGSIDDNNLRENDPDDSVCEEIQSKIDSLLLEIELLKEICPGAGIQDTMKIPEVIENLDFTIGRWRSTTNIHNIETGEKVVIQFDFFQNQRGLITLIEPNGDLCNADLDLSISGRSFGILQLDPATCQSAPYSYDPYTFKCEAGPNGTAVCTAQNNIVKANKFSFNLIKIN